jgi:phosphoglycerate-specific signal transduction histidine kinase
MSATINTGWLKGKNGVKFAPKTLSSQVITNDGIALEEKIAADLNEIKTYIDETVSGNEGSGSHDHNDTYYTESEIDSMLSTTASTIKNDLLNGAGEAYDTLKELGELIDENTDAIEALETIATSKADSVHSHNDLYYNKTEIDSSLGQKSQVQIITWEADD